jgi:hypothetical protein
MHFSLPPTIAAASLCTAAPLANTYNPTLEKRTEISGATPFWSGETMNFDQIQKGVDRWCSGEQFLTPTNQVNIY